MTKYQSNSKWKKNPQSGEWNNPDNWEEGQLPSDEAVFSSSNETEITFSKEQSAQVGALIFDENASSFQLKFGTRTTDEKLMLTISGEGVVNRSGRPQCLKVAATNYHYYDPQLQFAGSASAGGNDVYYESGPESLEEGYGGGIIGFTEKSHAGEANFVVRTGKKDPPNPKVKPSTVGGEVSFKDHSRANRAKFTIYGSLSLDDGDTFGNTVFHDYASADHGTFINVGATVANGDGGNTQFYDHSTSDHGLFLNFGASHEKGNGGDVAFDGFASASHGVFQNFAATAEGGFGGVTSFNNNKPFMDSVGASAGHAFFHNFGAKEKTDGGGGHTEFTAKFGSASAFRATIMNYGSVLELDNTAGYTLFSVTLPSNYFPSAGEAVIRNYPGVVKGSSPGRTTFKIRGDGEPGKNVPTADKSTIENFGGTVQGALGGFVSFSETCRAEKATLIAYGGINGGLGGKIIFSDQSQGEDSVIQLFGNGILDLSWHVGQFHCKKMVLNEGLIELNLGTEDSCMVISESLDIQSKHTRFLFTWNANDPIEPGRKYRILSASNLDSYPIATFESNSPDGLEPKFKLEKNTLFVSFS
ncbi:hypothetical protein Aoki45_29490 [Algoriphagus sp. oki45]|uniref:hypothetical protein n=1 Tax=Algoriphagus sp. oki45 TaxID=3067294 RepID=UPI0027F039B1|nr:hypothetical protein Aoki45_29490 [Algoriphagus sp. oki45]